MKVATPTVLGFGSRGNNPQPHRRCLPLTGSEENATMLNPTVRENLLFPSSSPSARRPRRFTQVQSMVAYAFVTKIKSLKPSPDFSLTYAYTNKEDFCATKQVGRNPLANPQSDFLAVFKLIFYQFFTIILPPRFDTTSKITAARRTTPFTTFCMLASTPISDIPRLITPIRTAPTITPGTVPIPP